MPTYFTSYIDGKIFHPFKAKLVKKIMVSWSPPATKETGAMGREIESRQGIGW
jgi:hypothetical protein